MILPYQKQFIDFLLANEALRFGSFTLKSGRQSPYFINTGHFNTGSSIGQLASFYVSAIEEHGLDSATIVFGPAYKGIPLCVTIAYLLAQKGNEIAYLFDRKEAKLHGEFSGENQAKNLLLGKMPGPDDNLVMVDDVLTTGGTKYEAVELLKSLSDQITINGLVISVDRQEKDQSGNDPIKVFQEKTGIPVFSIITIETIIHYLQTSSQYAPHLPAINQYRREWGVTR
ncbi:orotate phosphoribosyltransferase [bacterium]|nr:orotate phosphoribosyltransferase [bacterium]